MGQLCTPLEDNANSLLNCSAITAREVILPLGSALLRHIGNGVPIAGPPAQNRHGYTGTVQRNTKRYWSFCHMRRSWESCDCSSLENKYLRQISAIIYKYPMGWCREEGTWLSLKVYNNRITGKGHGLQHKKFQVDMRNFFFLWGSQVVKQEIRVLWDLHPWMHSKLGQMSNLI